MIGFWWIYILTILKICIFGSELLLQRLFHFFFFAGRQRTCVGIQHMQVFVGGFAFLRVLVHLTMCVVQMHCLFECRWTLKPSLFLCSRFLTKCTIVFLLIRLRNRIKVLLRGTSSLLTTVPQQCEAIRNIFFSYEPSH